MKTLQLSKLADVAAINPKPAARPATDEPISFIPMSAVNAQTGSTERGEDRLFGDVSKGYTIFANGDILVAKITPCFENGKIAQATIRQAIGVGSTEFHVIKPNRSQIDSRYLLHFLRRPIVRIAGEQRMTGSAGQRRVPAAFLASLSIPMPEICEQQRIGEVLDRADELRAKRRETLVHLNNLTQSIFLDMFAGEASNEWPTVAVADVAQQRKGSIRTGPFGSQLLHSEFLNQGVAVLGIDNAVDNEFRWGKRRFISEEKYEQLARFTVHPGDVLITIMGTCGRCAVVPDDIPRAINTKHLCCITLDPGRCLPEFLHQYFLTHPTAQRYLLQSAKGAIMAGLNMEIIKAMPIVLPPLALQQAFVERLRGVERLKAAHRASLAELDALFASLQDRAFRGLL
ncbi:restriction endonuclease subunit S [Micromonospora inyonensis]|uniref:Type I restriction enzyme, S subunit n=1 Tax=Micromonospora inyonensis TaxID=47866 RepID=A0A1C6REK0_9ACTN|nr:restriction endonuclease subunit S [Micromonospora inyonensis]SCL15531.1 type I restriction enzyme, S subunit [Micromonospora inyonensis]